MENVIKDDFIKLAAAEKAVVFKFLVLLLPAIFFTYFFFAGFGCRRDLAYCTNYDLGVVFPFYLLAISIFGKINLTGYLFIYLISSSIYLYILYRFVSWLEQYYARRKHRPTFTLKRI